MKAGEAELMGMKVEGRGRDGDEAGGKAQVMGMKMRRGSDKKWLG